jgi:hypothetical protein
LAARHENGDTLDKLNALEALAQAVADQLGRISRDLASIHERRTKVDEELRELERMRCVLETRVRSQEARMRAGELVETRAMLIERRVQERPSHVRVVEERRAMKIATG